MADKKKPKGSAEDSSSGEQVKITDAVKKILTAGIGAAFMTEEHIRSYVSDLKLPKEVLGLLLQQAGRGKEEIVNRIGMEIAKIFSHIDIVKEASRFVEDHKFKVTAEIEVTRKTTD